MITGLDKPLVRLCTYKTESLHRVTASSAKALPNMVSFISISSVVRVGPCLPPMPRRVSAGPNSTHIIIKASFLKGLNFSDLSH